MSLMHLEATGYNLKCSFCGKLWHEVQRIITRKDDQVGICDCCVREFIELMKDVPPEVPLPRAAAPDGGSRAAKLARKLREQRRNAKSPEPSR